MQTSSLIIGATFSLAGVALLMSQVLAADLVDAYRHLRLAVIAKFGHDTDVFPDYTYAELPSNT
jgi:hypothetical protein